MAIDDSLQLEPGLAFDEVSAGVQALIDADPEAAWDDESSSVAGSLFAVSPRIMTMMAYDPARPPVSGRNYVHVRKLLRLFVESRGPGSWITVRVAAVRESGATPATPTTWGRLKARYAPG